MCESKQAPARIRIATLADAEQALEVYRPYVEHTAISFEWQAPSLEEFRGRMKRTLEKYPYLVAAQGSEILGYAYLSPFVGRAAYLWSAETTIYLREDLKKQGLGKQLYQALEDIAKKQNLTNLYACIGWPDQEDEYLNRNSVQFHRHMGYRLVESVNVVGRSKLIIDDTPGISISEMRTKCRKYKLEFGLKMIIIDYLQLMSGSGRRSDNRQQEISEISRSLKALARELEVPVLALSQLSRAVESRQDKRPMLSDLRESGAIEQDADVVMFLYRDDYYNKDSSAQNIAEVIVAKQRNGPIGTVELVWLPQYTKFVNQAK